MKYERWASYMLRVAIVCALLVAASAFIASIRYLRPGPGFDYWAGAMPFLQSAIDGPWLWGKLWEVYGGAYIMVVGRLLYLLEWIVGDFRNYWMLAFCWLSLASTAAITLWVVWKDEYLDSQSRLLCVLLVLLACFSGQHMNNLSYTFNAPSPASVSFCLLFIVAVFQGHESQNRSVQLRYGLLAVLVAILLALSIFSLPALLATWVAMALGLRMNWRLNAAVTTILIIATLGYVSVMPPVQLLQYHFYFGSEPDVAGAISFWLLLEAIALFVLQYIAAPFSEYSLTLTTVAGALILFGMLLFSWKHLSSFRSTRPSLLIWLIVAYAVYLLALAFCTSLGRLGAADLMVSPRYRSYVTPFLMLSGIAAVYEIQFFQRGIRNFFTGCIVVLAFAIVLPAHNRLIGQFSKEYDTYVTPFVAMSVGLTHIDVVHQSYWGVWWDADNKQMLGYKDFLHDHGKGIYAEPYYRQIGQRITLPDTANAVLVNETASVELLPGGGYQWKGRTDQCGTDGRIALVNAQGDIVGAGLISRELPDKNWRINYEVFLPYCRANHLASWTGFLPQSAKVGDVFTAVTFIQGEPIVLEKAVMP